MVRYFDNCEVCGWFYYSEGCYYGDGTKATAERIEAQINEE